MTVKEKRRTSRPEQTPLHALLAKACGKDGSIRRTLAPAVGVSHQFIYRWISDDRVPPKYANRIVEASKGAITLDELLPFVLR